MNKALVSIGITSLCVLVALALWFEVPSRIMIDGLECEGLGILVPMDTEYASGYSHSGFNRILVGMSEREVLETLGPPLYRWRPYRQSRFPTKAHYEGWGYSRSPTSKSYRLRQINFDNGMVAEIRGFFYAD